MRVCESEREGWEGEGEGEEGRERGGGATLTSDANACARVAGESATQ